MTLSRESNANIRMELDQGEEREGCSNPSLKTLCAFHRKGRKEQAVCIVELCSYGEEIRLWALPVLPGVQAAGFINPVLSCVKKKTCYISRRTV